MASLVILKNPLSTRDKQLCEVPDGAPLIDWLQKHYPRGFGVPIRWFLGNEEKTIDDLDYCPKKNDVVIVMLSPAGIELTLGALLTQLLIAVITSAIVAGVNYLLFSKPKAPGFADQEGPSTVYDIASQQNAARIGEPVPVVYGEVLTTPDYCAQPYTFFGIDYEFTGSGTRTHDASYNLAQDYSPAEVYTELAATPENFDNLHQVETGWLEVEYSDATGVRKTRKHLYFQGREYPIEIATRGADRSTVVNTVDGVTFTSRVYEFTSIRLVEMQTVPRSNMYLDLLLCLGQGEFDVSDVIAGDSSWLDLDGAAIQWCKIPPSVHQNRQGNLGFLFNGTFHENQISIPEVGEQEFAETGDAAGWFNLGKKDVEASAVSIDIYFPQGLVAVNNNGVAQLQSVNFQVQLRRLDAAGNVLETRINTQKINDFFRDPGRFTFRYSGLSGSGWQLKVLRLARDSEPLLDSAVSTFVLTGARLEAALDLSAETYGDVTLLAVRLQATNGISGQAQSRIRVRAGARVENFISDPGAIISTASPADAFADIYCNTIYGAGRPLNELDTSKLAALKSYWQTYQFNAVFTGRSTVFEALSSAIQGVAAEPLPQGSLMSVNHNGVKSVRSMLFSPSNIVRDSFSINYNFDPLGATTGIEVEYRDPITFAPAYTRFPVDSLNPEKVTLFGCTNLTQAEQFAELVWLQRLHNRKLVTFETELEGLIPSLGERIAVSHTMPNWGASGECIALNGLQVTVDAALDWTGGPFVVILRDKTGSPSAPITVTQGAQPEIMVLDALPDFDIYVGDDQERTYFAFGGVDVVVKDFLLSSITPQGGLTVGITAVNYDETPYQGTLDFLDSELDYNPPSPNDEIWTDANIIDDTETWIE